MSAELAGAAQDDLVLVHRDVEPLGEALNRALQTAIVERDQPPAALTHEVMMMLARRIDRLVVRDALAQVESLHQTVLVQQIQDAIDARPTHRTTPRLTQALLDVQRRQRARLLREQLENRPARTAPPMAGIQQHPLGVLRPTRSNRLTHAPKRTHVMRFSRIGRQDSTTAARRPSSAHRAMGRSALPDHALGALPFGGYGEAFFVAARLADLKAQVQGQDQGGRLTSQARGSPSATHSR